MPFVSSSSSDLVLSLATGLVIGGAVCLLVGAAMLVWKLPSRSALAAETVVASSAEGTEMPAAPRPPVIDTKAITDAATAAATSAATSAARASAEKDIRAVRQESASALEKAAAADQRATSASERAASAETRANSAANDAAKAADEAAKARERAASLEKEAAQLQTTLERERTNRLALEAVVAPRSLTAKQQADLIMEWQKFAGKYVVVRSYAMDVESYLLGEQLIKCLRQAGLKALHARSSFLPFGGVIVGIEVTSPTNREFAYDLAQGIGKTTFLKVAYVPPSPDGRLTGDGLDPAAPNAEILIGIKPPPVGTQAP
jgi:hypothetical protein